MPDLVNVLFPAPSIRRSPLAVWRWWESRRLTYNAIVGTAGLATLIANLLLWGPGRGPGPWLAVAAYGLAANVCYSLGPVAELLLQRWLDRDTYGLGPALFRHGLVFSLGLTLLPIPLMTVARILRFVFTGH